MKSFSCEVQPRLMVEQESIPQSGLQFSSVDQVDVIFAVFYISLVQNNVIIQRTATMKSPHGCICLYVLILLSSQRNWQVGEHLGILYKDAVFIYCKLLVTHTCIQLYNTYLRVLGTHSFNTQMLGNRLSLQQLLTEPLSNIVLITIPLAPSNLPEFIEGATSY